MTLIELCIGMVITTLVLGALSALWFSVGRTWAKTSAGQNINLTAAQVTARLESYFRSAKYVFQYTAGSVDGVTTPAASAFYWKGDNWIGASDGAVQLAELALIEHDPAARKLYLYQAMPYVSMDAGQRIRAGGVATWADLSLASTRATFKAYDFVQRSVVSESVTGALFGVPATASSTNRQAVEFTLYLVRDSGSALTYSVAALRGPSTRPL
jgi:hypothetical protein